MYGVTDNSVRKWCKKYEIPYKYRDNHPKKEIVNKGRFLLDGYEIKMINGKTVKIYQNIHDAIDFIKIKYAKENTPERNIRTRISNAIKHNKKCYGFFWELIPKVS